MSFTNILLDVVDWRRSMKNEDVRIEIPISANGVLGWDECRLYSYKAYMLFPSDHDRTSKNYKVMKVSSNKRDVLVLKKKQYPTKNESFWVNKI